jgi:hypothetical protein
MGSLAQFASELKVWFTQIDPLACPTLVARAWQDIRKAREWSFLKQTGCIFAPSIITLGTVQVTQFSTSVVADGTAAPLWNAVAFTLPPAYPLTLRQFRVTGGPIYNIIAWDDATSTATLDRPYAETSASGGSYMIYQPYWPAPAVDFSRWLSIVDPSNTYSFRYRNLYRTQKEIDARDPGRFSYAIPIALAAHDYVTVPGDSQPRPRFEAWPHPVQQIGYVCEYMIEGDSLGTTGNIPRQVPDQVVMARARHYAHQVVAMQPNVDVKTKAFHLQQAKVSDAEYFDLLNRAKLDDNVIFDSRLVENQNGPYLSGPLDSNFLQSHVVYVMD